jgi:hypothetical protein
MIYLISQSSKITVQSLLDEYKLLDASKQNGILKLDRTLFGVNNSAFNFDGANSSGFNSLIEKALTNDDKKLLSELHNKGIEYVEIAKGKVLYSVLNAIISIINALNSNLKIIITNCYSTNEDKVINFENISHVKLSGLDMGKDYVLVFNDKLKNIRLEIFDFGSISITCDVDKYNVKVNDQDCVSISKDEFLSLSGKSDFFNGIKYYCKSKFTNEMLEKHMCKDNGKDRHSLIIDDYRDQSLVKNYTNINVSYVSGGIVTPKIKELLKNALDDNSKRVDIDGAPHETIKRFAAGWKYANIFIEYNATTKNAINEIIDNLDKSGEELDEIIKAKLTELGLMPKTELLMPDYVKYPGKAPDPSNPGKKPDSFDPSPGSKWGFWYYSGLFLSVCALVGGIVWFLSPDNHVDNDAVVETSITD